MTKAMTRWVVSMESDGRGSDGAGGSGDQLAAQVAGIDIGAVTERVTSEQSAARPTLFGGGVAGVKKPSRGAVGTPKRFRPRGSNGGGAKRSGGERRVTKRGDGQGGTD